MHLSYLHHRNPFSLTVQIIHLLYLNHRHPFSFIIEIIHRSHLHYRNPFSFKIKRYNIAKSDSHTYIHDKISLFLSLLLLETSRTQNFYIHLPKDRLDLCITNNFNRR